MKKQGGKHNLEHKNNRWLSLKSVVLLVFSFALLASLSVSSLSLVPMMLSDQGTDVTSGGTTVTLGNLTVEIWDSLTSGNKVWNNTYTDGIENGSWNVMLGEIETLNLSYGVKYFKNYLINGDDINFTNGSGSNVDRLAFYSPLGEIGNQYFSSDVGKWNLSGSNLYPEDLNYNVGIGTASPATALDVQGGDLTMNGTLAKIIGNTGLQVWDDAEGANDYARIYHDGTNGYLTTGSGSFYMLPNSAATYTNNIYPSSANTRNLGANTLEWIGLYLSEDVSSGVYFGLDQDARIYYNETNRDELVIESTGSNISIVTDRLKIWDDAEGANDYVSLYHDGSNAVFTAGSGYLWMNSNVALGDNSEINFGTLQDAQLDFSTAQATSNSMVFSLDDTAKSIIYTRKTNKNQDFDHPAQSNPTIFVQSDTGPDTNNTQWLALTHDTSSAVIDSGTDSIVLDDTTTVSGNLELGDEQVGVEVLDIYDNGTVLVFDSLNNVFMTKSLNVSSSEDVCITGGNCLSSAASSVSDVWVNETGDTMTGNLEIQGANLTMNGTLAKIIGNTGLQVWDDAQGTNAYVDIFHDGTNGFIGIGGASNVLGFKFGGTQLYQMSVDGLTSNSVGVRDLGLSNAEWRGVHIGEDTLSGAYFGLDEDWRLYYNETSADELQLVNGSGSLVMSYTNAGDVGIGTTSQGTKLDIYQSAAGDLITFRGDNNVNAVLGTHYLGTGGVYLNSKNAKDIRFQTSGTNRMIVEGGGNISFDTNTIYVDSSNDRVGIGTTAPRELLEVAGNINSTGGDICISGGNCLSNAGAGTVGGTGAANRAAFWTDSTTLDEDGNFTWDNTNKRLGIGTTSPATALDIQNGDLTINGSSTSKIVTTDLQVWDDAEAAGDYVSIYHDATNGYIKSNSGSLYLWGVNGLTRLIGNFVPDGANTRDLGASTGEFNGLYLGEDASSGVYMGLGQEARIWHDSTDNTTNYENKINYTDFITPEIRVWDDAEGTGDFMRLWHDGANGYVSTGAGSLYLLSATAAIYTQTLYPNVAGGRDLGANTLEWRSLKLSEDASSGVYFGLDQDWRMFYNETVDDELQIVNSAGDVFLGFTTTINAEKNIMANQGVSVPDNIQHIYGSSGDAAFDWSTAQATSNTLVWGLGGSSQSMIFTKLANRNTDHDHAAQSDPTIFIHSTTDPDVDNTEWLSLTYNNASDQGIIDVGKGFVNISDNTIVTGDFNVTSGNDICINEGNCLSNAGAGTVGGTGAANRAAFWTASSTLSYDDNFTWDNTNKRVGIGTSSPEADLHIGLTTGSGANVYSLAGRKLGVVEGNVTFIPEEITGSVQNRTGLELLLGYSGAWLDGSISIDFNSRDRGNSVNGVLAKIKAFKDNAANVAGDGDLIFETAASGASVTTERMRIASDGNVGIGTTAPDALLEIEGGSGTFIHADGTSNAYISLDRSGSDKQVSYKLATAGTDDWVMGIADSDEAGDGTEFFIGTGATATNAKLWIETSGEVGIGTTAPSQELEVHGEVVINSTQNDSNGIPLPLDVGGSWIRLGDAIQDQTFGNGLGIKFHDSGVAHGSIKFDSANSKFSICRSNGNTNTLECDAGQETMTVDVANNRIGIGSTAPAEELVINSTTPVIRLEAAQNPSAYYTEFRNFYSAANPFDITVTGQDVLVVENSAYQTYINGLTGSGLRVGGSTYVYTNATGTYIDTPTLFVDRSNDRVGVGTVSPTSALTVNGNLTIGNTTTVYAELYWDGQDMVLENANLTIPELAGSGTDYVCVDSTGRLFRSNTAC